jgi:hypothetical protein
VRFRGCLALLVFIGSLQSVYAAGEAVELLLARDLAGKTVTEAASAIAERLGIEETEAMTLLTSRELLGLAGDTFISDAMAKQVTEILNAGLRKVPVTDLLTSSGAVSKSFITEIQPQKNALLTALKEGRIGGLSNTDLPLLKKLSLDKAVLEKNYIRSDLFPNLLDGKQLTTAQLDQLETRVKDIGIVDLNDRIARFNKDITDILTREPSKTFDVLQTMQQTFESYKNLEQEIASKYTQLKTEIGTMHDAYLVQVKRDFRGLPSLAIPSLSDQLLETQRLLAMTGRQAEVQGLQLLQTAVQMDRVSLESLADEAKARLAGIIKIRESVEAASDRITTSLDNLNSQMEKTHITRTDQQVENEWVGDADLAEANPNNSGVGTYSVDQFRSELVRTNFLESMKAAKGTIAKVLLGGVALTGIVGLAGAAIAAFSSENSSDSTTAAAPITEGGSAPTAKTVDFFAHMWLYLPQEFTCVSDPTLSFPLYIGVRAPAQPTYDALVGRVLDGTEDYFIEYPLSENDPLGVHQCSDLQFSGYMLHLNSGIVIDRAGTLYKQLSLIKGAGSLQQLLEGLAPRVSATTDYKGSAIVAAAFLRATNNGLFTVQGSYPNLDQALQWSPLLNGTMSMMSNSISFGMFTLQQIKAISSKNLQRIFANVRTPDFSVDQLVGVSEQKPYEANGVYVYQTQDTPLAQRMIAAGYPEFFDYVIIHTNDNLNAPVPLFVPALSSDFMVSYGPRSDQNCYLQSLLDGRSYKATDKTTAQNTVSIPFSVQDSQLDVQIASVKKAVDVQMSYGPFTVNGIVLSILPDLVSQQIYIYERKNFLLGGASDYLIAVTGDPNNIRSWRAARLPNETIIRFVSLVTSCIYDENLNEYAAPGYQQWFYGIAADGQSGIFPTAALRDAAGTVFIYTGRADLYDFFIDADCNRIEDMQKLPPDILLNRTRLLYTKLLPSLVQIEPSMAHLPQELTTKIDQSYAIWKASVKTAAAKNGTTFYNDQFLYGPFTFSKSTMLRAFSYDAIEKGIAIYTIDTMPGDYVILAAKKNDPIISFADLQNIGERYSGEGFDANPNQSLAISIVTGIVYDRTKDCAQVGTIDLNSLITQVDALYPDLLTKAPQVYAALKDARFIAEYKKRNSECKTFGATALYLSTEHAVSGQYVYADVTGISLDDLMLKKSTEIEAMAKDWYVCVEGTTSLIYGVPLDMQKTTALLSLSKYIGYNRSMQPTLFYQFGTKSIASTAIDIKNLPDTLQGFYMAYNLFLGSMLMQANLTDYKALAVYPYIAKISEAQYAIYQEKKKELEMEAAAEKKLYPPLDVSIGLLRSTAYEPESPVVQGRNLVKVQNKYYQVIPTIREQSNTLLIADYNPTEKAEDTHTVVWYMVYPDAPSVAVPWARISGKAADIVRATVGVAVDAQGGQTLTIAIGTPGISVDGATMIPLTQASARTYQQQYDGATTVFKNLIVKGALNEQEKIQLKTAQKTMTIAQRVINATATISEAQELKKMKSVGGGTKNIEGFYYNSETDLFYIRITESYPIVYSYYLDMITGYGFDVLTGMPVIISIAQEEHSNRIYTDLNNKDIVAVIGMDGVGLPTVDFKNPLVQDEAYKSYVTLSSEDFVDKDNQTYQQYVLVANTVPLTKIAMVKKVMAQAVTNSAPQYQYDLYLKDDTSDTGFTKDPVVNLVPSMTTQFAHIVYAQTIEDGKNKGFIADDDAANAPVFVLWEGQDRQRLRKLYYRHQLLDLSVSGQGYTATMYGTKTI